MLINRKQYEAIELTDEELDKAARSMGFDGFKVVQYSSVEPLEAEGPG
jgi:hypothetical protein